MQQSLKSSVFRVVRNFLQQIKNLLQHTNLEAFVTRKKILLLVLTVLIIVIIHYRKTAEIDIVHQIQIDPNNVESRNNENNAVINVHGHGESTVNLSNWLSADFCDVQCETGKPCEYKDEVDLRIIVMTYRRQQSLKKCLDSLLTLLTDGDRISVEVWVDRSLDGVVDYDTVQIAESFKKDWNQVRYFQL